MKPVKPVLTCLAFLVVSCELSVLNAGSALLAEKEIGPAGGLVTADAGHGELSLVEIDVPAGALSAPVRLSIAPASDDIPIDGGAPCGLPIDLGPDGTQFAVPVTVTLPCASALDAVRVHGRQGDGATFVLEATRVAATSLRFSTTHFSEYQGAISDSTEATCGNAVVEAPEECDDGNDRDNDGCTTQCRPECAVTADCPQGYACDDGRCEYGAINTCHGAWLDANGACRSPTSDRYADACCEGLSCTANADCGAAHYCADGGCTSCPIYDMQQCPEGQEPQLRADPGTDCWRPYCACPEGSMLIEGGCTPNDVGTCILACGAGCPAPEFQLCASDGARYCNSCVIECHGAIHVDCHPPPRNCSLGDELSDCCGFVVDTDGWWTGDGYSAESCMSTTLGRGTFDGETCELRCEAETLVDLAPNTDSFRIGCVGCPTTP